MTNPCWKCPERIFGCHASCGKYTAWKSEHESVRAKAQAEQVKDYDYDNYLVARQERARRSIK